MLWRVYVGQNVKCMRWYVTTHFIYVLFLVFKLPWFYLNVTLIKKIIFNIIGHLTVKGSLACHAYCVGIYVTSENRDIHTEY